MTDCLTFFSPYVADIPPFFPNIYAGPAVSVEQNDFLAPPAPEMIENSNSEAELSKLMHRTWSLDELRKVVRELSVDFRGNPSLSRIAFRHILKAQTNPVAWTIADIYGFLGDPQLNTPGAENVAALMRYLATHPLGIEDLDIHVDYLKQAIAVGITSPDEIGIIIKQLPNARTAKGSLASSQNHTLALYFRSLWDGLQACSVLKSGDLGCNTLTSWLEWITQGPHNLQSIAICNQIIGSLGTADLANLRATPDVILHVLRCFVYDQDPLRMEECFQHARKILRHFRPDHIMACVSTVTHNLVASPRYSEARSEFLATWAWILERIDKPHALLQAAFLEDPRLLSNETTRGSPGVPLSLPQMCLVRLWTITTLGKRTRHYQRVDRRRMTLFKLYLIYLRKVSQNQTSDMLSQLRTISREFKQNKLPHMNGLLATTARIEFQDRLQYQKSLPKSINQSLQALDIGGIAIPDQFWDIDEYRRHKPALLPWFQQVAQQIDITGPDFLSHLLYYTETNSPGRDALIRVLRLHTPLKISLAWSWRERAPPKPQKNLDAAEEQKQAASGVDGRSRRSTPDPHACLDTIHSMALVFACSYGVTPRTSWRLTHWCYLFLIQHGAPLLPAMVRALYHAGIQRYREANLSVPIERREFIISLVRAVEGERVANTLESEFPLQ